MNKTILPIHRERELRTKKIKELYKMGYSMNQIVEMTKHSKHTVFRAIHKGRENEIKK